MRGHGWAAFLVLALSFGAGCKKGEIDEKTVSSRAGVPTLGIAPFSVVENSTNSFLFTISKPLTTLISFTWTVSSLGTILLKVAHTSFSHR